MNMNMNATSDAGCELAVLPVPARSSLVPGVHVRRFYFFNVAMRLKFCAYAALPPPLETTDSKVPSIKRDSEEEEAQPP